MNRLEEIRQRLERATPGPWFQEPDTGAGRVWVQRTEVRGGPDCEPLFAVRGDASYKQREHDAELIAHAPEDIALLLEIAEAAAASQRNPIPALWHEAKTAAAALRGRLDGLLDRLTVEIPE